MPHAIPPVSRSSQEEEEEVLTGEPPSIMITDVDSAAAATYSVLDSIRAGIDVFCGSISAAYADPNDAVEVITAEEWMDSLVPLTDNVLEMSGFDGSSMKTPTWDVEVRSDVEQTLTGDTLSCRLVLQGESTNKNDVSHILPTVACLDASSQTCSYCSQAVLTDPQLCRDRPIRSNRSSYALQPGRLKLAGLCPRRRFSQ